MYKSASPDAARRIVIGGFQDDMEAQTRGEGPKRGIRFSEQLPSYEDPKPSALIAVQVAQGLVEGYDIAEASATLGSREFVLPATLLNFGFPDIVFGLNEAAKTTKKNELRFWARRADRYRTVSYKIFQNGDDVYMLPRGQEMFKVSLHASGVQQESHLQPFWDKISDGGSRHLERWTRPQGQPGQQVRLFKVVLPAREMVPLNPLKGESEPPAYELNCSGQDDVVEVSVCFVQGDTPGLRRGSPGITVLAEWPYLDGVLVVLSETGKIKPHELELIAQAGTDCEIGFTEGPRNSSSGSPRTFLSLDGSDGVKGWMEIRDQRPNPPPPLTFKR